MANKNVYIPLLQGKDVYNANLKPNSQYKLKYNDSDEYNTKKFISSLDYSLDLIKLKETYCKERIKGKFAFKGKHGKEYCPHVINLAFDYSHKDFNQCGKNRFIASGYTYNDIKSKFTDHIYIEDGKLIAIEVNAEVEKPCKNLSSLCKYFEYCEKEKIYKRTKKNFKVLKSSSELREHLYKNGFMCDGIKFVRWKRSSGSARIGNCLFINEKLCSKMHEWEKCGLEIQENAEIDLAAWEAYIALTSSSIIDTMKLSPKNFLIVDDYNSTFEEVVTGVSLLNGKLDANEKKYEITNSIWDGQSLLDESCFCGKYEGRSMLLLRQRFFKSACFKTKIQKYFADNGITEMEQIKNVKSNFTLAEKIEDIKIITTPSSIKYVKFGSLEEWLKNLEPTFGIVKYDKPTKFFNGRLVQTTYQLLNSLNLNEDKVKELTEPSIAYIKSLRKDPSVLMYHIKYPLDELDSFIDESDNTKDEQNSHVSYIKNDEICYKLMRCNSDFTKTQIYYQFRDDVVNSLRKRMKQGKLLVRGNYSTLLGNGYEMLQQSIGQFNGKSIIPKGCIHSTNFPYEQELLASRNPHICAGNILVAKNAECPVIDKYFDLSPEVVYVNAIGENIQQRLSGCDYDSDTMLITDNPILLECAKRNYDCFKVPTNFVPSTKIKRCYNDKDKADLDARTSNNKI